MAQNSNGGDLGFEKKLWAAADKMRNNMDAAEYKHVALGLIFLKYVSDAVKVLGDEKLKFIAVELVKTIRNDIKIDWALKDSIQAEMRVKIKKILRKYGYPPDKQKKATETVLEQAKLICGNVVNE